MLCAARQSSTDLAPALSAPPKVSMVSLTPAHAPSNSPKIRSMTPARAPAYSPETHGTRHAYSLTRFCYAF